MTRKHGKNKKYFGEFKEAQSTTYEIETHADFIKGNLKIWALAIVVIFGSTMLATFLCLFITGGKI